MFDSMQLLGIYVYRIVLNDGPGVYSFAATVHCLFELKLFAFI